MDKVAVIEQRDVLGKAFRIFGTQDNPLFLAKDVAQWIDLSNVSDMIKRVDNEELTKLNLGGQSGEAWLLTEDGLYEVLMQSRKPIAKKFKKEVKKILKEIRHNGAYMTEETIEKVLSDPDTIIEMATRLKHYKLEVAKRDQVIGELKPKAEYLDQILNSKSLMTITQIAKDYGMSGKSMNTLLHDLGVQYKESGQWLLYAKHHGKGYTSSQTIDIPKSDGTLMVKLNTKWTQKGRLFLYELLKDNGVLPEIER